MKISVVSGGLGRPSTTRLVADEAVRSLRRELAARGESAEVTVIELRDLARDIADRLVTGFGSPALTAAISSVAQADLVVAVTPVFSASYSGLFKSFFDVLEPNLLSGKVALIAATGGSARHSLVLDHALRPLMSYLGMTVVPTGVFAATADFGGSDTAVRVRVERAAREAVALAGGSPLSAKALPDNDFVPFGELLGR